MFAAMAKVIGKERKEGMLEVEEGRMMAIRRKQQQQMAIRAITIARDPVTLSFGL